MKKWKKRLTILVILFIVFPLGSKVMADDDEHEEKHEFFNPSSGKSDEHEMDLEEKYEEEYGDHPVQIPTPAAQLTDYWNIWSREPRNNPENSLPIRTAGELKVKTGTSETLLYFIPQEGQLLVSAKAIADVLGVQTKSFTASQIVVLIKDNKELIIRAGSNAVYENKQKTPMPVQAAFYENSVYLPISVAANALNVRVEWDQSKHTILLKSMEGRN